MTNYDNLLGKVVSLPVRRIDSSGVSLSLPAESGRADAPELLLRRDEVPPETEAGDELDVFIYQDSQGRPVATTRSPRVALGEVAFLTVTDDAPFGAFVDWGLPKELLIPLKEQAGSPCVGQRYPIGVFLDDKGRLTGTMHISEMLKSTPDCERGKWVKGEAWRGEPDIGLFVIVERRFVGLLPAEEPHSLSRGDAAEFRVANVLPDGKITLSLRGLAQEERGGDAERILVTLARADAPRVGDRSSPDRIRAVFGVSKKAFKRAVGMLLKQQKVRFDDEGFLVLTDSSKP